MDELGDSVQTMMEDLMRRVRNDWKERDDNAFLFLHSFRQDFEDRSKLLLRNIDAAVKGLTRAKKANARKFVKYT